MEITKANRKSVIEKLNREGYSIPATTTTSDLRKLVHGLPTGKAQSAGKVLLREALSKMTREKDEEKAYKLLTVAINEVAGPYRFSDLAAYVFAQGGHMHLGIELDDDEEEAGNEIIGLTFKISHSGAAHRLPIDGDPSKQLLEDMKDYASALLNAPVL